MYNNNLSFLVQRERVVCCSCHERIQYYENKNSLYYFFHSSDFTYAFHHLSSCSIFFSSVFFPINYLSKSCLDLRLTKSLNLSSVRSLRLYYTQIQLLYWLHKFVGDDYFRKVDNNIIKKKIIIP